MAKTTLDNSDIMQSMSDFVSESDAEKNFKITPNHQRCKVRSYFINWQQVEHFMFNTEKREVPIVERR